MGIKRNDLADGKPPCKECNGVGTVLRDNNVQPCGECKGRGWVLPRQ